MEGLTQNDKIIWSCWEEKSPREVVRESANKGTHINLAVKFLMNKNGWNESTAKDWFHAEVCAWIVQLLMRKQIFKVVHVLNKVGLNVEDHLIALARESAEIQYRDFIIEHLEKMSKDFGEEKLIKWHHFCRHWNLLRYLEHSFEKEGTFKQNKVFGIGKDRIIVNETEIKALTIEKVESYPDSWKSKIATCLFFDTFEFSLISFSTPFQVWNHLLENNKAMILVHWINIQMSEVVRDMNTRYNFFNNEGFVHKLLNVDAKGLDKGVLEKLDEIFRKWFITDEMIDAIPKIKCFSYTKMCIYDTLCSYGIVNEDEKNNLYAIISRLARTQNLKLIDDVFTESCSTINKRDFYIELAKYCVEHKLYQVMTVCVEGDHNLGSDLTGVESSVKECIELWLLFKSIEKTSDRQSHVVPVYKTCEQIANDDINGYISAHPQLVLGLLLLDDDSTLFNIFNQNDFLDFKNFRLPKQSYKEKLPHLHNVYKKYGDVSKLTDVKDINVYQLLAGYRGLDVSKVFEFQLINQHHKNILLEKSDRRSLGSLLGNEIKASDVRVLTHNTVEMPHFANVKLMKRYGYMAKLNHIYYLKQYRPCNASQAIVTQQYQMYNRLQEKGIKKACGEAHALALENWNDEAMTACAIAFVAMIGCNPVRCRIHVAAAKMMKNYMIQVKNIPKETAVRNVNDYMSKLSQSSVAGSQEVLQYLEEITMHKLQETLEGEYVEMSVVLYECQTMVKFAMLHNLPLPEQLLKEFVKRNMWYNFLLYGDVFRYPFLQMLTLSQEFDKASLAEHLKHVILHRNLDDVADKEHKPSSANSQRKVARLSSVSSVDFSPTYGGSFEFPEMDICVRDMWEVAAACHGPQDPPGALVRAAGLYREPFLALIATCYEPNAVGVLWAYWVLSALGDAVPATVRASLRWELGQQQISDEELRQVAELCLRAGYVRTLHESALVFYPESPLAVLTAFLCRCIWQRAFGQESGKILHTFIQNTQRKYSMDSAAPWAISRPSLQKIAVALVKIALTDCFDSAYHQKLFLKCVVDAQFGKDFLVPCPDFTMMYEILQISMETSMVVDIVKVLNDNNNEYIYECIDIYIANRDYDVALQIAKLAAVQVNNILTSEWAYKHAQLSMKEVLHNKDITLFIAQASEAFKKASVTFSESVNFLVSYITDISDPLQKFYSYRLVLSWYEENLEFGADREKLEHLMWASYFQCESKCDVFLNSHHSTLHFILTGQKDRNLAKKIGLVVSEKPFSMLLSEIEIDSDVANIENIVLLEEPDSINAWRRTVNNLLELKLMVEAFRLSTLFKVSTEFRCRPPPCSVLVVRTCLKLAEGSSSPYEMPQELRLVISSPYLQHKLTTSETSDMSFEELVVISEKQDSAAETHLAAREDADRLSALEAFAARSGLALVKQVANYYRISLQIGWNYATVLKYKNNPMDFINYVSGKARMSLASLVFRTFNIPSRQISEYLCNEVVAAIISPHLVKTSTFRQKEHFQYTLWGYPLNSDVEIFLNMRPDACTNIGRLILDNLMAFRKIYKCNMSMKVTEDLDDSSLDVDNLIDEEYQNVGQEEVDSLATTEGGTLMSADTESMFSVSTVYSFGPKITKEARRNLFDMVSKSNIHIRYEVKSNIRKITKGAKLSTKQVNIICIELLVLAHECFSSACDTEGVAVVLRSAQALTAQLLAVRSWRLMVRLLTGLARYTEMAYVFQALRDNHQFEFLLGQFDFMLGQQQDKITEFKQGLLDFLKNHCPGDTDTYILVALHFNMYTEVAHVKRKQATDLLVSLERMAAAGGHVAGTGEWLMVHDNAGTRSLLRTALDLCTEAAEWYLQGGCPTAAGEQAARAQTVALQMALLDASPTRLILNRSNEQLYTLVSEYLSFMEGLVLLNGREAQWRSLAYRRALTNDQAYLRDMAAYRPDLAQHFLHRYKSEKKTTAASQAAMTELKNLCR